MFSQISLEKHDHKELTGVVQVVELMPPEKEKSLHSSFLWPRKQMKRNLKILKLHFVPHSSNPQIVCGPLVVRGSQWG